MSGASGGFPIALETPGWPPGAVPNGVVTYVSAIVPLLRAQGHPVSILAASSGPGPHDLPVYDLAAAWGRRPLPTRLAHAAQRRLAPALYRQARWRHMAGVARRMIGEQGVRIIEMEESFGMARWVQRAVPVPVVVRLHGPWFLNGVALGVPRDAAFAARVEEEGKAIEQAVAVSAPSRNVLDEVRRQYGLKLDQAVVIPNPTPPVGPGERWRAEASEPGRVLFVGRFDRHKGGDLILDAFARVLAESPRAHLTFVGPDRGLVDDAGRAWSLPEYVRRRLPGSLESGAVELLGQLPFSALGALRRRAQVTAVCSRYENFPGSLTEALAHGCPTVAAETGGIPELVQDGVNGLLHRPGDADHLAGRVLELLRDPARAARLGAAAAAASEKLRPAEVVPLLLATYRRVLAG